MNEFLLIAEESGFPSISEGRITHLGGEVVFNGMVRTPNLDKEVLYLEFEAYPELFENQMRLIAERLQKEFGVASIQLYHRIGKVYPGEIAVTAVVRGKHRKECFAACDELVNELKRSVPIWKKEVNADGSFWVSPTP